MGVGAVLSPACWYNTVAAKDSVHLNHAWLMTHACILPSFLRLNYFVPACPTFIPQMAVDKLKQGIEGFAGTLPFVDPSQCCLSVKAQAVVYLKRCG